MGHIFLQIIQMLLVSNNLMVCSNYQPLIWKLWLSQCGWREFLFCSYKLETYAQVETLHLSSLCQ